MKQEKIKNIRAFVRSYLGGKAGQSALSRQDKRYKDKDTGKFVTVRQTNQMATAFQEAINAG